MWVLLLVFFVGVLVFLSIISSTVNRNEVILTTQGTDMTRVTAVQGLQMLRWCINNPPGLYSQAAASDAAKIPPSTPVGRQWMCSVTAGGSLPNGNVAVVYMDGPPSNWAGATGGGQTGAPSSAVIQANFATQVGAYGAQMLGGSQNMLSGIFQAGDPLPSLYVTWPSQQTVSLAGDVPGVPLNYTTPAMAAGVIKTAF